MKLITAVIGSGGRENAAVYMLNHSSSVSHVFIFNGNKGFIGNQEKIRRFHIPQDSGMETYLEDIAQAVKLLDIDVVFVGYDNLLADGIVDTFVRYGLSDRIVGPTKNAARIESSKAFAKQFMTEFGIPTAPYAIFSNYDEALTFALTRETPLLVKVSGPAFGKGALICESREEVSLALSSIMVDKVFGSAGDEVVIEDYMPGIEFSVQALVDRSGNFHRIPVIQDHKRIGDGNTGKNTGGMGAVGPLDWVTEDMLDRVDQEILERFVAGMIARGTPYAGFIYPSIMLGQDGSLRVIEFNARPGDPEMQAWALMFDGDFGIILKRCAENRLLEVADQFRHRPGYAACIALVSEGYPDHFETGYPITGFDSFGSDQSTVFFAAGMRRTENGIFVTAGGRVGYVVSHDDSSLEAAVEKAYRAAERIRFEGMNIRHDIGTVTLEQMRHSVG